MKKFPKPEKHTGEWPLFSGRDPISSCTRTTSLLVLALLLLISASLSVAEDPKKNPHSNSVPGVLWVHPDDIATRNLFYGPGGKDHEPHMRFTFLCEDLNGTNPKFDVLDENGTRWRVKLGPEARPEIAASRLLWAVGYFATEDYFLADLRVEDMKRLKRGQKLVGADGTMKDVRLKRLPRDQQKAGNWRWRSNPFVGTREFNGLRVMMALMNSWDLKDENNSVYEAGTDGDARDLRYVVSDLGATFGTTGLSYPNDRSKGNFAAYANSKFIKKGGHQYVDFNVPTRPNLLHIVNPKEFLMRLRLQWIGKRIPRADARWIGQVLSQLSREQVRQAFQASSYSPEDVERFTDVVEKRIAELNSL